MKENKETIETTNLDSNFPPQLQLLKIPINDDYLVGRLFAPQGKGPHPTVVLLHGFPGGQVNYDFASHLQGLGYQVLVFHYRGTWGSKGDFSISNALEDVETAVNYIRHSEIADQFLIDANRIALIGHSFGGFIALMMAAKDSAISVCASIAGANLGLLGQMLKLQPEWRTQMEKAFEYPASFVSGYSSKDMGDEIISNFEQWNLVEHASALASRSTLLIGSTSDTVNPIALHHHPLVQAFEQIEGSQMDQLLMEDTDHGFEGKRTELFQVVSKWILQKFPVK